MIMDILAIIISSLVIVGSIIATACKVSISLGKLAQEVRGHNKRLDTHADILETMRKEIKSIQIDRHGG